MSLQPLTPAPARIRGERCVEVAVAGAIDISTQARFRLALTTALNRSVTAAPPALLPVFVNLTAVTHLAAAGLGELVEAHQAATARGIRMRVIVSGPVVLRPIQLTGLDQLLDLVQETDDARFDEHRCQAARPGSTPLNRRGRPAPGVDIARRRIFVGSSVRGEIGVVGDRCRRDIGQFDVEVLGGPAQYRERRVGVDASAAHQDALGLADDVTRADRAM
jgi:anti-anti-sigma factor